MRPCDFLSGALVLKIAVPSLQYGKHVLRGTVRPPRSKPPRSDRRLLLRGPSDLAERAARPGLSFSGRVDVDVTVPTMNEQLFVEAGATATVRAECARCLEEFELPLSATFAALYVPASAEDMISSLAHRAESESQRVMYYSGGVVDLTEQIIEALSLAAPMKPLCRPDCKGICASCGKNLNEGNCGCTKGADFNRPFEGLFENMG